jgi:hypothetical protein
LTFKMDDYVDVSERIRLFYERYPDGRLTRLNDPRVMEIGQRVFIVYDALAYRTADDPHPAVGTAWEPIPGPTQFTRDSELMNAETAAWGRAIIAAGIPSKRIASAEEVQARRGEQANGTPPKQRLPDDLVAELAEMARVLVASKTWTGAKLKAQLVAAGAKDTSTVKIALGTLTAEQADVLKGLMADLIAAAEEKTGAAA